MSLAGQLATAGLVVGTLSPAKPMLAGLMEFGLSLLSWLEFFWRWEPRRTGASELRLQAAGFNIEAADEVDLEDGKKRVAKDSTKAIGKQFAGPSE